MQLFLIGLFGLFGIFSRYFIDQFIVIRPGQFPLSTLTVNLLGSFIAGYLFYVSKQNPSSLLTNALVIGLCGGLTTFSTFSVQILNLLNDQHYLPALSYMFLSPLFGLVLAVAGFRLANLVIS